MATVSEMARVLHPLTSRAKFTAVFIAYIDESGGTDKTVYTVGGFAAPENRWKAFERQWNKVTREYDVPALHMTDFTAKKKDFKNDWSQVKRIAFMKSLATVVKTTIGHGHGMGISLSAPLEDFRRVIGNDEPKQTVRKLHTFLFQQCVYGLHKFLRSKVVPARERMAFVHDRNREVVGPVVERFEYMKDLPRLSEFLGAFTFEDKTRFIPLQAADMMVFEGYKYVDNYYRPEPERQEVRKLLTSLAATDSIFLVSYGEAALRNQFFAYRSKGRPAP